MIARIREYLKNNVGKGERITLDIAAKGINVKRYTLSHFLGINGVKFKDMRGYYEMECAASLFESGKSRDEVSGLLGYENVAGLDYAFRKNFDISPKKYMEQHLDITFKL